MSERAVKIRAHVWYEHDDLGPGVYHQWVLSDERVKADSLGRQNANMYEANWIKARCGNPDCVATAIINVADVLDLALGGA
jgi:hypothetical protein